MLTEAIIDDVVGLVIVAVVSGLAADSDVTVGGVAKTTGIAFGFLVTTLLIGRLVVPPLAWLTARIDLPGTPTVLSVVLAFGLGLPLLGEALIPDLDPIRRAGTGAVGRRTKTSAAATAKGTGRYFRTFGFGGTRVPLLAGQRPGRTLGTAGSIPRRA